MSLRRFSLFIMMLCLFFGGLFSFKIGSVFAQNDAGSGGDAPNVFADALLVSPGQYYGWMGENDTEDWYKFQVMKGQVIYVNVRPPKDVDVNLYLWDSLGNSRTSSTYGVSSAEYLQYVCDVSGEWRIRLVLASGSGWYRFNLTVQNQNDAGSGWDAGNIYEEATYIETESTYHGYLMLGDADDWFKFYASSWKIIQINLTLPIGQSVQLSVIDPLGNVRASSSYSGAVDEYLTCVANIDGNWSLKVHLVSWQANYTFSVILFSQNDAGSGGDAGNTLEDSIAIQDGIYSGQLRDVDTKDYYAIDCTANKWLNIFVNMSFPLDCDIKLFNSVGTLIASSSYARGLDEYISYYVTSSAKFYISVELKAQFGFYSLNVTQSDNSWLKNAEESGDAGNTFFTATKINEGYYSGSLNSSDSDDWFKINVLGGQVIVVGANMPALGIVYIYAPDGSQATYGSGLTFTVSYVASSTGDWRIRFWDTDAQTYNFILTIQTISKDIAPPTTTAEYDGLWRNTDFTIALSATDDLSGVAETFYRINNGPVQNVSFHGQPLINIESSNNTLEYWSVDNSGNEELPHNFLTGIKLDKTQPVIEIPSRTPSDDVQPFQPVKVSVNATDNLSGLQNVTLIYSFDNGTTWEPPALMTLNSTTNLYEATIPGTDAGTIVRFKIAAYDNAGNDATRDGVESYCVYQVIPEFSLPSLLPALIILLTTLSLIVKKKTKRN